MRKSTALAWLIAGTVAASIPVILTLNAGAGPYASDAGTVVLGLAPLLAALGMGLLLALKRPSNPIGWLLLSLAVVLAVDGLAPSYAEYSLNHGADLPGTRVAAAWVTWGWPLVFASIVAIAFVFPDGRLPSSRWRPAVIAGAVTFPMAVISGFLWDEELDAPYEEVEPFAVLPDAVAGAIHSVSLLGMIATLVLAALAVRSRFKGAEGVLRTQIKWVAYAATLIPVAILAGTIEGVALDRDPGLMTEIPFVAAIVAITVAIGVAVLRYRLYEIDRLISVTVLYAVLTALLAAAFVGITLLGGVVIGGGSPLTTAVATLAVTLAFRPLRARLQTRVDRRFNRARYKALQRVDAFLADLRVGRAEPESVGRIMAESLSDPTLRLFFWLPDQDAHADAAGRIVSELPAAPAGRTPVRRGELQLGTVVHDGMLGGLRGALDQVIVRAGLAIEIARLRVEVRRQLSQVEESRARIVLATHAERRRLERDLHDGAQQRLVSIGLDLRHLQQGLQPGDATRRGIDDAVGEVTEAIAELRELARGVRPATLDHGLAPALAELATRAPIPINVHASPERFPDEVEAAAYFVASEALTNAVKHSEAGSVTVRAQRENGSLELSVEDDGRGGASPAGGTGLIGLADRVAALGGRMELDSAEGRGTKLVAEFPCE